MVKLLQYEALMHRLMIDITNDAPCGPIVISMLGINETLGYHMSSKWIVFNWVELVMNQKPSNSEWDGKV